VVANARADAFGADLRTCIELARKWDRDEPLVFINAWNEWAEGCHLEPDQRFGHDYLDQVRAATLGS